jgi:hypothetical protein
VVVHLLARRVSVAVQGLHGVSHVPEIVEGRYLMARDIFGKWMQDVWIADRCLRVFWRGFSVPQMPYASYGYGHYVFGAGPIGFMFWPERKVSV